MDLITTTAAVTGLWTALEVIGLTLRDEAVAETLKPISTDIAEWIQQKTGWKDKNRHKVFLESYHKAEENLIKKYGVTKAYKIFRQVPIYVDSSDKREEFVLNILENNVDWRFRRNGISENIDEEIIEFVRYLRAALWETQEYRPLIEFYTLEESQKICNHIWEGIRTLSETVDNELNVIRVMHIESVPDYEKEREMYLKQVQAFFEEQEFVGFPDLKEKKRPTLLKDIYIPLKLSFIRGGDKYLNEIGKLVNIQSKGESNASRGIL